MCLTPSQDARLRELYPAHTAAAIAGLLGIGLKTVYRAAKRLGLKKSREWIAEQSRLRIADPAHPARAYQFTPGIVPWNKGIPYVPGGRSVETRFKPGKRPHTWHPVGYERVTDDGYRQRKMTDTGDSRRDYVNVHWLVWREAGRDIPSGHALIFRNGDKTDIRLENLELVTRAELMRRNTFHRYGQEIARVIQLRGVITRQINRKTRQEHP